MPNKIETKERMLKMKEVLWNYVTTNYSKERYYSFLYANALHLLFEEELFPYMSDDEKIQHSNMKENNLKKELLRFCEIKTYSRNFIICWNNAYILQGIYFIAIII